MERIILSPICTGAWFSEQYVESMWKTFHGMQLLAALVSIAIGYN